MKSTVCTLFEGDYHYGVGALVNSLYKHGFRGVIWVGYRRKMPPWVNTTQEGSGYYEYEVAPNCAIRFVKVSTQKHLNNYKPDFITAIWERDDVEAETMFYFDPDIVVKKCWAFFLDWVSNGIALCQDVNWNMPADHPIRLSWKKFAVEQGYEVSRQINYKFNGGFVGLLKNQQHFLHLWQELLEATTTIGADLSNFTLANEAYPNIHFDQDLLNLAAMITDTALSTIGPDGMDFISRGDVMSHAAGGTKPWRKKFMLSSLHGVVPSPADKAYLQNTEFPINLYTSSSRRNKHIDLRIGSAIGRFISRR